ncbi:Carbohydrate sulfotransferase 11 [Liparis tanakae]|uniref:Carbohydrate sulfotransferase n=1 Tax=Liparis tanakae TaxID=230148 RepID=A0A4Z2F068_9TELE|nr:Carbohydrate sulfotransferase 11 [Liparis tanakae]
MSAESSGGDERREAARGGARRREAAVLYLLLSERLPGRKARRRCVLETVVKPAIVFFLMFYGCWKTLNQYTIAEINHRLKNYLKFLFVREPFERLVSAYRNKFTLKYNSSFHKRFGTRIIRRYRKNATQDALLNGADVKFKEFAEYLVDPATQRDGPLNEHWQTAYQLCHPCHIHYDLVGKYETLEEDANYVLRLVGVGDSLRFPSYAKSTRTTDAMTAQFFSNISTQQQIQLNQLYKLDFLMFNYSTPSYLRLD